MVNLLLTSDDRNTLRPSPTVVWGVCVSSARLMSRSVVTMLEDADKSPMALEHATDIAAPSCLLLGFVMMDDQFGCCRVLNTGGVRMSSRAVQQMREDENAHAAPFLTKLWGALSEFCNSELDKRC